MKKSDDPEKIILSEHDKFFKEALSDLRVARDFLQAYMPKDLLSITDIDHLVSQDKQFLNEVREDAEVDVLYKTTIGDKEAYIYLLLEHQSKVDRLMPFRMLKYSVAIISRRLQMHRTKKIPLVSNGCLSWIAEMAMVHGYSRYGGCPGRAGRPVFFEAL